jgi:hypothetical protein
MTTKNLTREQIIASDPFASGANLDLSGYLLPSSTAEEQRSEPFDKDGFNRVDFGERFAAPSVAQMLASDEVREELATGT